MTKAEQYLAIFQKECGQAYPEIDAFEKTQGFAVDRARLEAAAYPLACPLKINPPSWQHGRVLYAMARKALAKNPSPTGILVDIGTAKGFSAVVLSWAAEDAGWEGGVASVDVMEPESRQKRNSYLEGDFKFLTVSEFVDPFRSWKVNISFFGCGSVPYLRSLKKTTHIPLAFVDGKHDRHTVHQEGRLIRDHQKTGDIIVFDDIQIPAVALGVKDLSGYSYEYLVAGFRKYAVATRI
jgi:hypothetical protein